MARLMNGRVNGHAARHAGPPIVVGLVNSMPGEAMRHTERQFEGLLNAASAGVPIEIRLFSLDEVLPAGGRYGDADALEQSPVDALIVTGMPPRAAALRDEPFWPKLTRLVDLAIDRGWPTVWSCLAAHAAVLHLDGIERQRLPEKLSGLVACAQAQEREMMLADMPQTWHLPHSRYNELPADALLGHGYRLLSCSDEAGADLFVKHISAPFLFCQGHPEYDAHALLREYHRDVRQYLIGARADYPAVPRNYFGPDVAALLGDFRRWAERNRGPDAIAAFPMSVCAEDVAHGWRDVAVTLYANWLAQVRDRPGWKPAAEIAAPGRLVRGARLVSPELASAP